MSAVPEKFASVFACALVAWLALLSIPYPLFAQTTVGTGSIVGTVTDPSDAVVSGAKVTITNRIPPARSTRTFAWPNQFRRLRVRYEKRADIHEAFIALACALLC